MKRNIIKKSICLAISILLLVSMSVINFSICAEELVYYRGDCTLDGKLDTRDSLLILQYCAKIVDLNDTQIAYGDFDGNGKINTVDSLGILSFLVFGGEEPPKLPPPDEEINVENIIINSIPDKIYIGDKFTLNYKILPENTLNKSVSFESENESVATIDENGVVSALNEGNAILKIVAQNGCYSQVEIHIEKKQNDSFINLEDIKLSFDTLNIFKGETRTIDVCFVPENASDKSKTFSSNNNDIASVDEDGLITANSIGSCEISIQSNNIVKTVKIYVNEKDVTLPSGEFILKLKNKDLAMSIGEGEIANKTNVFLQTYNISNYKNFSFKVSNDGNIHTFSMAQQANMVLDVYRTVLNLEIGQNIDIYENNDPDAQKFNIIKLYNGSYAICLNTIENSAICAISDNDGANIYLGNLDFQNPLIQWDFEKAEQTSGEKKYNANVYNTGGDGLNVRQEPDKNSAKIGFLNEGQAITVLGEKINDWFKVTFVDNNGEIIIGYCHSDYIKIISQIDNSSDDKDKEYYISMIGKRLADIGPHGNHSQYYKHPDNILDPSYCGQCTWYAYGRFNELTGIKLLTAYNAKLWLSANKNDDRLIVSENKYDISSKSIAVSTYGTYGHVMIVEYVERDTNGIPINVYFTEANWYPSYNDKLDDLDGLLQVMSFDNFLTKRNIAGYINKK